MVRHAKPEFQLMTPDIPHTQASVQITTETLFQITNYNVTTTFLRRYNDTMIQLTNNSIKE